MNDKIKFGLFLTTQRQRHSMRSQELAEKLGISVGYLSQLEHGLRTNPSLELLESFAGVLHLNKQETETLYDLYASLLKCSTELSTYSPSGEVIRQQNEIRHMMDALPRVRMLPSGTGMPILDGNRYAAQFDYAYCK